MARKLYVGGNWKMNLNAGDGADLAESIAEGLARGPLGAEVVPPKGVPHQKKWMFLVGIRV